MYEALSLPNKNHPSANLGWKGVNKTKTKRSNFNMNEFSKNQLIKFEYFGEIEKLIGLYKSYRKIMKDTLCMLNTEKNCGQLTDVTMDGTSLAVIITATMCNELCVMLMLLSTKKDIYLNFPIRN